MKKYILLSIFGTALLNCKNMPNTNSENKAQEILFSDSKNSDIIKLKKGGSIALKIEENPSTGYHWAIETEKNCSVAIDNDTYKQNDSAPGMVGVPGIRTLDVLGKENGKCKIDFKNTAPAGEITETKTIYFVVEN
ncbi:putative secreted protein [Chryseobacterium ginsenosidimutans]|uniref:protease inhibitor I42 family protein n=1 Tax=Chryseobacterium ginsenosidimutans TaxID=687846 RepID=UPI0021684D9E|nr:protease inhibitor I42 family protein [Chryseobacterium ginsenosidimutans]MCS3867793.1 putative secreted protein [Chryseobacterium ginsenosidimutans]